MPVYLDGQHGAFHGTNPELGSAMLQRPALDRRLSLCTTETTIRSAGRTAGAIKEILSVAEIMLVSSPNRSGPVAGRGRSLKPPRMARVVPGRRPVNFPALDQIRPRLSQSNNAGCPTRALWRD
jgi:hypothetical protein